MPSGYSATLPADILLDSGLLLINNTTPYGVSMGDLAFDPGITRKQVGFDGQRAPIVGLDRTVDFAPKISGSMKELSGTRATGLYEAGSTSALNAGVTTITPKNAGILLVTGEYLTNVRLAFPRGSGGYAWVKFPKALCTKYDIAGKDKDEAVIKIEIEARLDMSVAASTDVAPYLVEFASSL
jgi:hypothetical protein